MARRIDKLQINALNASNNNILVARGGELAYDDPANVFVGTAGDAGSANVALVANFANIAGIANVSLEANLANVALEANIANLVLTLSNFTTDDLNEGSSNLYYTDARVLTAVDPKLTTANVIETSANLYFTNARAIAAVANQEFTLSNLVVLNNITANTWSGLIAGSGITIEANGRISSSLSYLTLDYAKAASALGTSNFSNLKVFDSSDGESPIVYSMHATNMKSDTSYLTVRVTLANTTNPVLLANLIQIPGDSSIELLRKPQIFKEGDRIEIRSFNSSGAPTDSTVSVFLSYSATEDTDYERKANTLTNTSEVIIFESSGRTSQIDSIKLINSSPDPSKVSVYIKDNNDALFAWITSNISIPPHSSLEVCEYSKALPVDYKIAVRRI